MLISTLIFGSFFGFLSAITAMLAFGTGLGGAFLLYLFCALVPSILSIVVHTLQLASAVRDPSELASR